MNSFTNEEFMFNTDCFIHTAGQQIHVNGIQELITP